MQCKKKKLQKLKASENIPNFYFGRVHFSSTFTLPTLFALPNSSLDLPLIFCGSF